MSQKRKALLILDVDTNSGPVEQAFQRMGFETTVLHGTGNDISGEYDLYYLEDLYAATGSTTGFLEVLPEINAVKSKTAAVIVRSAFITGQYKEAGATIIPGSTRLSEIEELL